MDTKPLERLTQALYRVTDRMADQEPLKWALRRTSLELSQIALKNPELLSMPEEEEHSRRLVVLFSELIQLLELASSTTYISRVNFEVLIREYRHIQSIIFQGGEATLVEPKKELSEEVIIRKKEVFVHGVELSDRRQKILEYLSGAHRGVSISDVVNIFGGSVGEKTIQRDLVDLASHGSIRSEGERRWRRYFINQ